MRTDLEPGLHLGLAGVGTVGGQPVAHGGVRLLVRAVLCRLLGHQQPFGQLLRFLRRPLQGLLGAGGGRGHPLGLARGAAGLAYQSAELLGHPGLLPLRGPSALPQLLDERRATAAPFRRAPLRPGQLRAPHREFGHLGRRLVHGRLDFEEAGRPRRAAVGEVRRQDVPLAGHRRQLRAGGDQVLGILQRPDDDHVPHQSADRGHQFDGAADEVGDGGGGPAAA